MKTYFSPDYLKFYKELAANNNKEWFDENRGRYHKSVKEPFEQFVNDLIVAVQKKDKDINVGAKDCIFRINRDVRFSKDKTPYKIRSSAIVAPGGKKGKSNPGFYFELGPESAGIYGGAYFPDTDELLRIRTHISKNLKTFEALTADKKFKKYFGELQGEESSRVPANLKAAAEKQPLILRKQFYFGIDHKPSLITGKDLMKTMLEHYEVALPMMQFLRKALK
jgi:uncharacterized protein (TIGR02453 family)